MLLGGVEMEWPIKPIGGERNRFVCHYCGLPADTLDHIPPRSCYRQGDACFQVPACNECNVLAGNTYHAEFRERCHYVKTALAKRYAHVVALPDWSADELQDMGAALKASIRKGLRLKRAAVARIAFSIR